MGEPVGAKGVPLYTDARHYTAAGIPTVLYGAGPRSIEEANAHRAAERLPLDDLHKTTEVVALTLYDLLRACATTPSTTTPTTRRNVLTGQSGSERVDLGGRRLMNK